MRTIFLAAIALAAYGSPLTAYGLPTASVNSQPRADSGLRVFLVTLGEGEEYWEKYGHNALWFTDSVRGIDVAYNWGTFDFRAPDFLKRILIGDTKYWVEAVRGRDFLAYYKQLDRTIVLQRLNFTPAQVLAAYEYAQWNALEENKYYRYDYFRDNCSTRVRDVIDRTLGGTLKAATAQAIVPRTYRTETLRLVDDLLLTQFGINAALGEPADRNLSLWEDMFVPSRVRDAIRGVRVMRPRTPPTPLVAEERVLYQSQHHEERASFPRLWAPYFLVGLLLAAEFVGIAWAGQRSGIAEKIYRIEVAVWALLTGLLGAALLLAWLITQHVFWYRNENLFLLNPLSLWLAVVASMSIWRARWLKPAAVIAALIAMLSALALIVKGLPWFTEDNIPMILLLLPPHMAIAYGLWRRSVSGERSAVSGKP